VGMCQRIRQEVLGRLQCTARASAPHLLFVRVGKGRGLRIAGGARTEHRAYVGAELAHARLGVCPRQALRLQQLRGPDARGSLWALEVTRQWATAGAAAQAGSVCWPCRHAAGELCQGGARRARGGHLRQLGDEPHGVLLAPGALPPRLPLRSAGPRVPALLAGAPAERGTRSPAAAEAAAPVRVSAGAALVVAVGGRAASAAAAAARIASNGRRAVLGGPAAARAAAARPARTPVGRGPAVLRARAAAAAALRLRRRGPVVLVGRAALRAAATLAARAAPRGARVGQVRGEVGQRRAGVRLGREQRQGLAARPARAT